MAASTPRRLLVAGIMLALLVLGGWFVATHPTGGFESDGGVLGREIILAVEDTNEAPIPGINVEKVRQDTLHDRELSRTAVTTRIDSNGNLRFPAGFHGTSGSGRSYLLGLWKWTHHSRPGTYEREWSFLWGLIKLRTAETCTEYVFTKNGQVLGRIREDELLRLPVARHIPLQESFFAAQPNAPYFTRNDQVEVTVLTVRPD